MKRLDLSEVHPIFKVVFTILTVLLSFIVVFIFGALLGIIIWDKEEFLKTLMSPDPLVADIGILKFIQAFQTIGLFLVPSVLVASFFKLKGQDYLRLKQPNKKILFYGMAVAVVFLLMPLVNALAYLTENFSLPVFLKDFEHNMKLMEENYKLIVEAFANVSSIQGLCINLIVIALLPAISEEFLFRGIFQRIFSNWTSNIHLSIFITAFLFSAMHLSYFGFLSRLVLGMGLGYLVYLSGSIWVPVVAHFVNNAMGVIAYYLYYNDLTSYNPTEVSEIGVSGVIITIATLPILYYLFVRLRKIPSV